MRRADSTVTPAPPQNKGTGVRPWLLLDFMGQNQVIEAGKHYIMRRTSLSARDLRVLDPFLSHTPTVFGRERAVVISLEHIKAIIMAKDPFVQPLVQKLEKRILCYHQQTKDQVYTSKICKYINIYCKQSLLGCS